MDIASFVQNEAGEEGKSLIDSRTNTQIMTFLLGEDLNGLTDDIMLETNSNQEDLDDIELPYQPQAVALWVSTSVIPPGLPSWFGPLNRHQPTPIRVALHINQTSKVFIKTFEIRSN